MSVESAHNEDPQFLVPCSIGAFVGFVVFAVGCTWMGVAGGYDFVGSLGVGLFAASWGGTGFGCMFGAIYAITRPDEVVELPVGGPGER